MSIPSQRDRDLPRARSGSEAASGSEPVDFIPPSDEASHWKANLRVLLPLLVLWWLVSFGAGILFVEPLNRFTLPFSDCPLGFWFAQQGSIFVFVGIIYVYVRLMNRLDRELGVGEDN